MVKFPWDRVEPGQGFFVPCLDTTEIKRRGLVAAMHLGIKATARIGIYKGRFGVFFIRDF